MKIVNKLTLGFTGVVFLIAIFGFYAIYVSQRELTQSIGSSSALLAQEMIDEIDRSIYYRIVAVKEFIYDAPVKKAVRGSNIRYKKMKNMEKYIEDRDILWKAQSKPVLTPFMLRLIGNDLSRQLKEMSAFYEKQEGHKVFAEIFITNKYGANIAQSAKTTDFYQADEEWWQKAKEKGLYVGEIGYDDSSGVYSTDLGIRLDDEAGNFIGVVKAVVNMEDVVAIINQLKNSVPFQRNVGLKLLTSERKIIYSTEPYIVSVAVSDNIWEHIKGGGGRQMNYFIEKSESPGGGQELFAHALSAGFKDYKGRGWVLLIEYKTKEILASVKKLKHILLFVLMGTISIVLIIWVFISHMISRPIVKLADAAEKIGKGNLDTGLEIRSNDEFSLLADAFHKMKENLRQSMTSVDKLNIEVSERKKAEKGLKYAYEQLKSTQEQLIHAEKLNAVGQLASGVAHEVRNPLGIIIQGINFLESRIPAGEKEISDVLVMLKDNIKRANNIIGSLLDFSKAARLSLQPENINSILESSLELVKNQLQFENIEIIKEMKISLPQVMADKYKLEQVFVNVLLNAVQAMPQGGRIIIRSFDKQLEGINDGIGNKGGDHFKVGEKAVIVEFEDTGAGISEEDLKKLFVPFFTTKGPRGGTGLGLSVSRNILHMHKALIYVESRVGKGTKITLVLKIAGVEGEVK
ncbi:MAG: ATP-binding protein [Candidatus Omnitrophica bacterium]|nr:ATP-binding protein [Candidatus Omnitrophota bacterium]